MNAAESKKNVNPVAAMISLAAIVITIVLGLKLGWGAQMSVFVAAIVFLHQGVFVYCPFLLDLFNQSGDACFQLGYYSSRFAKRTRQGLAMRVRSRKSTNSFHRFRGISLLMMMAPTSVR